MQRVFLLPLQSSRAAQCSGWLRHWDRRRWQPQSCHCWSKNCRCSGTTWQPSEEGHDRATLRTWEHECAYASTDPLFTLKCDANEDFSQNTQGTILWWHHPWSRTAYWMKWLSHVVMLWRIVSIYCHYQADYLVLLRDIVNNLYSVDVSILWR